MDGSTSVDIQSYGPDAMAEEDLCRAVGEDLAKHYPGYDWMVGVTMQAGTIAIDLMADKPPHLKNHGYLLHVATLMGPGGHHRVMQAGGEMLERFGLRRGAAPEAWRARAAQNGLDATGEIGKSRF